MWFNSHDRNMSKNVPDHLFLDEVLRNDSLPSNMESSHYVEKPHHLYIPCFCVKYLIEYTVCVLCYGLQPPPPDKIHATVSTQFCTFLYGTKI